MTTFERVLTLLSDGEWHHLRDLVSVSHYPQEWLKELQRRGLIETASSAGNTQLRLL